MMMHHAQLNALSLVLAVAVVFSDIQPGYLDFDNLPETNFSCEGKVIGGYYADVETGCQMFHVCTIGQKGEISDIKFLCLNGTVFDQETRVCERIDEVDCDKSEDFFNLNLELYGNTANFGTQECADDECEEEDDEEDDDTEYDDDTESTTIVTTTSTTERTTTTTTTRPTTVRTTQTPTAPRTQGYTRYTTQQPDSIAALLALHNAFNQGLNRRPILNHVSSTRLPSITSTTTRRPSGGFTVRNRFGHGDQQNRPDQSYVLRPRPTFQPSFTSSIQTPLKSNFHSFESGDTHFAHSFDPDKPYHFQYFAQKSSPSPFTVRIEPEVSVVTSTSTSTSIRIANTTVDESPYEDYDGYDPFFHDVQKITRPKRSTTQRSSARLLKTPPNLDLDNFFHKTSPKQKTTTTKPDHVIKIDPSDVLISKNYTSESPQPKSEYLDNLIDSIIMEDTEKKRVVNLIRESEPEMEKLINSKGVDLMLEKLENKLLEMELEGRGSGVAFEYEGDSLEIREKRGSENRSLIGNIENLFDKPDEEPEEIVCKNPEFCINSPKDDEIKFEIEDRRKRSTKNRGKSEDSEVGKTNRGNVDDELVEDKEYNPVHHRRRTTATPNGGTKKSRRKILRTNPTRSAQTRQNVTPRANENSRRKTTQPPEIKPVTEEIENDITTVEYRRPPIPLNSKMKHSYIQEHTTPFSVQSSTRLQTRFDYENHKTSKTTKRTTQKPTYYRHVPVYEDDYTEIVELEKKSHKVRRSPIPLRRSERIARDYEEDMENVRFESVPIRRTKSRSNTQQPSSLQSNIRTQTENLAQVPSRSRNVQGNPPTQNRPRSNQRTSVNRRVPTANQNAVSPRSRNSPTTTPRQSFYAPETGHDLSSPKSHLETNKSPPRQNQDVQSIRHRTTPSRAKVQESTFDQTRDNFETRPLLTAREHSQIQAHNAQIHHDLGPTQFTEPLLKARDHSQIQAHNAQIHHDLESIQSTNPSIHHDVSDISLRPSTTTVEEPLKAVNHQLHNVPFDQIPIQNGNSADTPRPIQTQQIGRRRKVTRNRNQYTDRAVLPEEIPYLTRPSTIPSRTSPLSQNSAQFPISRESEVALSTTTLPPAPYSPGPNIEQDPNFSCRGKVKGGLYADVHADCHGFFICSQAKRGIVPTHFWCGVGTRFNQKSRTCQAASQVDCGDAERLYYLNDNQFNPSVDIEEKLRGSFEPMRV